MSKIQLLRVLVNERLSVAAEEIFAAVEKTIAGYEEEMFRSKQEIRRQRRLLNAAYKPDIKLSKLSDQPQLSLSVWEEEEFPEEQQHCEEEEWDPALDQGDQGYNAQIHKGDQELYGGRGGEQLRGLEEDGTIKFIFTPPYVKDEHDPTQPSYSAHGMAEMECDPIPSTSAQQMMRTKCGGGGGGGEGLSSDCSAAENGESDDDDDWKEIGLYRSDDSDSNEDKWKKGGEGSPSRKAKKMPMVKKEKSRINCKVCGKSFHAIVSLVNHMEIHAKDVCGVCGEHCESEEGFQLHLKSHVKADVCGVCGKCFGGSRSLEMHMRVHTGEKPFICSECGKSFNCHHNLRRHIRIHTGEKPYSCGACGKCFSDHSTLKRHLVTHLQGIRAAAHQGALSDDCPAPENADDMDDAVKGEAPALKRHQTRTICEVCGKMFHSMVSLVNHAKIHATDLCGVCGTRFESEEALKVHLKTHKNGKVCDICGKCFDSHGSLEMHMRVHTGEKPFLCSECGKSFNCRHNMMRHMRTHTGEKPYLCNECGRCFSDHSTLKQHVSTHTGEKPHRCDVCGKGFHRKTYVRLHMKSHTSEK